MLDWRLVWQQSAPFLRTLKMIQLWPMFNTQLSLTKVLWCRHVWSGSWPRLGLSRSMWASIRWVLKEYWRERSQGKLLIQAFHHKTQCRKLQRFESRSAWYLLVRSSLGTTLESQVLNQTSAMTYLPKLGGSIKLGTRTHPTGSLG